MLTADNQSNQVLEQPSVSTNGSKQTKAEDSTDLMAEPANFILLYASQASAHP